MHEVNHLNFQSERVIPHTRRADKSIHRILHFNVPRGIRQPRDSLSFHKKSNAMRMSVGRVILIPTVGKKKITEEQTIIERREEIAISGLKLGARGERV